MSESELAYLTATDALALMRDKSLSPVEYLEALIERIERLEPTLNAVADRRYDEARVEAAGAAQRYASGTARALEGLPVAAKEEHPMVGRVWSQGSLVLADEIAPLDHPIIERIQNAGGIIHIRTTTPEFCCAPYCHSRHWGITRNPWNTEFSPGGSSGGSGAALAAGYAPLATGSDIGGSIRIPASLSGVIGFKPPWARVPALPPYNLDQYCHDGPLARTVGDVALLEDVISGRHWRDSAALPNPPQVTGAGSDVRGLRVALCVALGDWPLDEGVEANTRAAAAALAAAGAIVEEVTLPWTVDNVWAASQAHFATIMAAGIAAVDAAHGELLSDYTRAFAAEANAPGLGFYEGLELEGQIWEPVGEIFERVRRVAVPDDGDVGLPRRRAVPRRHERRDGIGRAQHPRRDDTAVQHPQPLRGAVRAVRSRAQRCAHRRTGGVASVRRRHCISGSGRSGGQWRGFRVRELAARARRRRDTS